MRTFPTPAASTAASRIHKINTSSSGWGRAVAEWEANQDEVRMARLRCRMYLSMIYLAAKYTLTRNHAPSAHIINCRLIRIGWRRSIKFTARHRGRL